MPISNLSPDLHELGIELLPTNFGMWSGPGWSGS